jgi:hypothetical protein
MRLSLITALGLAAFLGMTAVDTPDANAQARQGAVVGGTSRPAIATRRHRPAIATRRHHRVAMVRKGWRGARGAVTCRTVILSNGVRVRRCGAIWRR